MSRDFESIVKIAEDRAALRSDILNYAKQCLDILLSKATSDDPSIPVVTMDQALKFMRFICDLEGLYSSDEEERGIDDVVKMLSFLTGKKESEISMLISQDEPRIEKIRDVVRPTRKKRDKKNRDTVEQENA